MEPRQSLVTLGPGTRVLLGVSGGIAAYKACTLVRLLRARGCLVRIVCTQEATRFVSPLTLEALSDAPVFTHMEARTETGMAHIALARWAQCYLIAPATAETLARCAGGFASDLLSALYLSSTVPVCMAPAMNQAMMQHPATQANLQQLQRWGVRILGPATGAQACGETGPGRMLSPEGILCALEAHLESRDPTQWAGRSVWITAGPTQEALDPVRTISNRSSGKMGCALAEVAAARGAQVTLVAGPLRVPLPEAFPVISVVTAEEMRAALRAPMDCFIGCAAVSDLRVRTPSPTKWKRTRDAPSWEWEPTPDILYEMAHRDPRPFCVGFAADTAASPQDIREKLARKGADLIVYNDLTEPGAGFEGDTNAVTLYDTHGGALPFPCATKFRIAAQLLDHIALHMPTQENPPCT